MHTPYIYIAYTYMPTSLHTYILTYIYTYTLTSLYIHTYLHPYIYIHPYIHTYYEGRCNVRVLAPPRGDRLRHVPRHALPHVVLTASPLWASGAGAPGLGPDIFKLAPQTGPAPGPN